MAAMQVCCYVKYYFDVKDQLSEQLEEERAGRRHAETSLRLFETEKTRLNQRVLELKEELSRERDLGIRTNGGRQPQDTGARTCPGGDGGL